MSSIGIGISNIFFMYTGDIITIVPPDDPIIEPDTLTLELPVPSGVVDGDMLLALISTDSNPILTLPAGWDVEDDIGGTAKSFIDRRLSPGGEPATYTWTLDGAEDAIGSIIRFINVDPDDPINTKVENSGTGSTIVVPAITTTVQNTMLITLISLNDGILIDETSLSANRQTGLWLVNSSGTEIGSVGSSASYKTLRQAKTYSSYNLNTLGDVSTDYYIIQVALAPDLEILYQLLDSNDNKLVDSDNNKLFAE